jgi:hypothetical protein
VIKIQKTDANRQVAGQQSTAEGQIPKEEGRIPAAGGGDRAIHSNLFCRLQRQKSISASIPCAEKNHPPVGIFFRRKWKGNTPVRKQQTKNRNNPNI